MKSKRGFTLIELLAVIVVLGIIMLIAVTAVNNVIINSRLSGFKSSSQMLEKAASTYVNTNNLIVGSGATLELSYSDLKNNGHINRVVDPKSNSECTNSRVYVKNVSGTYKYTGALVCENYMDIDAYNLVTNGDFSNGTTGWSYSGATHSVSNNILTSTGTGSSSYTQEYESIANTAVLNHKYYMKSKARVTNANATNLIIIAYNGTQYINFFTQLSPTQNQWYTMSGIGTFTSGAGTPFYIYSGVANYADAATANGKVMQIDGTKGIYAIDLTAIYGAGNEPTATQMDSIMNNMGK